MHPVGGGPHGAQGYDMAGGPGQPINMAQKLAHSNEQAWIAIGSAAEAMEDYERAIAAYDSALRHNPYSVPAMNAIAGVHRTMDRFEKAVDYFQRVLNIVPENGETWGAMGHCYLMMDDLQKAYTAYQQALYHLPNPKEPKLWYGIGILYDRYGSLEHAEEAFASVVRMDPNYEKANEIYFRLGIIYKQQNKYSASLECFRYILHNPPRPLTEIDIWFQIGHVHEQQKEFSSAKEAYEHVLAENPNHAKVLQQLGWLYHQSNAGFENQDMAIQFLTRSLESDANDAQSWYLLGRAYMAERNYNKAYEAYQQAVYRDGKNPTFWCSIGVLYYQISQYRDALDAYSRAIRLNPYISEVWFDLGSLYESCNNQISDAIDAYARALELDPENPHIQQRLTLLRNAEARGEQQVSSAPMPPQDIHPTAYANHPGNAGGPPNHYGSGPPMEAGHPSRHSQSPTHGFHDGHPPSIPNIEENGAGGHGSHRAFAPMDAPRPGQSPSPPQHHMQHGRTSPRSQAYSSRQAEYARDERWRGERDEAEYANGSRRREADDREYGRDYDDYDRRNGAHPGHSPAPALVDERGATPKSNRSKQGRDEDNSARSPNAPSTSPRGLGKGEESKDSTRRQSDGSAASSSGSGRPLAAAAQVGSEKGRAVIDEDYDSGAADALMGLAGAASASVPIARGAEEDEAQEGGKEADQAAERLEQVKERAEAAAEEEDRIEREGGALKTLGKRGALDEDGGDGDDKASPDKRARMDGEPDAENEASTRETDDAVAEVERPSDAAPTENGDAKAVEAAKETQEALDMASSAAAASESKDVEMKADEGQVSDRATHAEAEEEVKEQGEEDGQAEAQPVKAKGSVAEGEVNDDKEKPESTTSAADDRPQSRAQSELEEGEVA
jgi:tetratricopeptide (TPR) repeat protein